jgi:hypothetical protein
MGSEECLEFCHKGRPDALSLMAGATHWLAWLWAETLFF